MSQVKLLKPSELEEAMWVYLGSRELTNKRYWWICSSILSLVRYWTFPWIVKILSNQSWWSNWVWAIWSLRRHKYPSTCYKIIVTPSFDFRGLPLSNLKSKTSDQKLMSLRSKIWSRHGCNFFFTSLAFFFSVLREHLLQQHVHFDEQHA